jgi:hypothetical protein
MACPDGIGSDSLIYCTDKNVLLFDEGGDDTSATYRVLNTPEGVTVDLYLSYRGSTGALKLVADPKDAKWQLTPQGNVFGIRNTADNDYVWTTSGGEAYLTRHGDPTDADSQWIIEKVS